VKLKIVWIGKTKQPGIQSLTAEYLKRISYYTPTDSMSVNSEAALVRMVDKVRPGGELVLLDSRGKQFSSDEFADFLSRYQTSGETRPLIFAVGPADGFSDDVKKKAGTMISLGKMTLPHELARVVLLEQLYRGLSILKGHPYHTGH
jgi:23S rRNA (pseudouridine1915-N3)-methyltransferase